MWAWPALTDIHHQGFAPGRMSDPGEHGQEAPAPPVMRRWSAGLTCEPGATEHAGTASRRALGHCPLPPVGEVGAGGRVSGCSGPRTRSRTGSSAANWSRAPAGSPASPVQRARSPRRCRVSGCSGPGPARGRAAARRTGRGPRPRPPPPRSSGRGWRGRSGCRGCSGPRTRSRTGSSAANWSRAPAASPASPVQVARLARVAQGVRVLRAEDPLAHGQQRGELVAGPGRIPRLPGPAGEVGRGRSGCPGAPGRGPARGRAAARRTGPGPRPHPPLARSSRRVLARAVRVSGCSGPRTSSSRVISDLLATESRAARNCRCTRGSWRSGHMPALSTARAAWACGSSAAQTGQACGQVRGRRGSRPRSGPRRPAATRRPCSAGI